MTRAGESEVYDATDPVPPLDGPAPRPVGELVAFRDQRVSAQLDFFEQFGLANDPLLWATLIAVVEETESDTSIPDQPAEVDEAARATDSPGGPGEQTALMPGSTGLTGTLTSDNDPFRMLPALPLEASSKVKICAVLVRLLQSNPVIPDEIAEHLAFVADRTVRTIRIWQSQELKRLRDDGAVAASTELVFDARWIIVICAYRGNVDAAYRDIKTVIANGAAFMSPATFRRRYYQLRTPYQRKLVKHGRKRARRAVVHNKYELQHRNEKWLLDHVQIPLMVKKKRGNRHVQPWLTIVQDHLTRYILAVVVSMN